MTLPQRIDQSFKARIRRRSPAHLSWVRSHRCCVPGCQLMPIEAAHVRRAANGGTGLKPSDAFAISLCREHHAQQHRIGEESFEKRHDINMRDLAREFYQKSPHRNKLDDPHG